MENRFEHTPQEENQGWGAYVTPPSYTNKQAGPEQSSLKPRMPHELSMCDRVRDELPYLLENDDNEISADTVRALFGHLGVCPACSREFDEHQRIAAYLASTPAVEMPMDFTGIIQRKIQVQSMAPATEAIVTPASSRAFGTPAATATAASTAARTLTTNSTVASTLKKTSISSTRHFTHLQSGQVYQLTVGGIAAAVMAFFVTSPWGSEMLGNNIAMVRAWLNSVGAVLGRIPVLGRLMLLVFTALAQIGDLLGNTYRTVGEMAVRGLAMDIGVCIAAYYFLVARKQRDSAWIRRA